MNKVISGLFPDTYHSGLINVARTFVKEYKLPIEETEGIQLLLWVSKYGIEQWRGSGVEVKKGRKLYDLAAFHDAVQAMQSARETMGEEDLNINRVDIQAILLDALTVAKNNNNVREMLEVTRQLAELNGLSTKNVNLSTQSPLTININEVK